MMNWRTPLSDLDYGEEERTAVERVLRSKWLSMGPEVAAFEFGVRRTQGLRHAVAVANGTAAIYLSLAVAGVGAGDEVVQPALNFVAAANMTVALGAVPVFADIVGPEEPTISADEVARLIGPRTKAVVAMHYGGNLARVAEIPPALRRARARHDRGRVPCRRRAGARREGWRLRPTGGFLVLLQQELGDRRGWNGDDLERLTLRSACACCVRME